jgi:adhesin/invasin
MAFRRSVLVRLAMGGALLVAGCGGEKALLAPTGAALSLAATATALSFNGTASVTARILTAQGQPAPDGTMVTFATTLGAVAPAEVSTAAGVAMTTFTAGVASGTAIVTASSGSVGGDSGIRIAIGVAAVARVQVTATPPTIPFGGGTSVIVAVVVDANNNPLVGIPVTFATTAAGASVAPANVKTDPKGIAQSTLTASQKATVTVTAGAAPSDPGFGAVGTTQGSVDVAAAPQPVPVVTVTPPANPVAQVPATFTVGVTPAAGSNTTIASVSVDFDDGDRVNLGAVTGPAIAVQHIFAGGGTYTVSVTATDSGGGRATAATVVAVGFQVPAGVKIVADSIVPVPPPTPGGVSTESLVTLTATLAPASLVGARYVWTFGDDKPSETTTLNQVQHVYAKGKTYRVKVDVTPAGSTQVVSGTATIVVP